MKGTYAGYRYTEESVDRVKNYIAENAIPNANEKIHTTLLYSRKYLPNYIPLGMLSEPIEAKPAGLEAWDTCDGKRALVLITISPEMVARHNALMKEHDAMYDYDKFKTHVTLSYDIGDMDITNLPPFEHSLFANEEYYEELDLDWANNN